MLTVLEGVWGVYAGSGHVIKEKEYRERGREL
jgi:hypothetical protein